MRMLSLEIEKPDLFTKMVSATPGAFFLVFVILSGGIVGPWDESMGFGLIVGSAISVYYAIEHYEYGRPYTQSLEYEQYRREGWNSFVSGEEWSKGPSEPHSRYWENGWYEAASCHAPTGVAPFQCRLKVSNRTFTVDLDPAIYKSADCVELYAFSRLLSVMNAQDDCELSIRVSYDINK